MLILWEDIIVGNKKVIKLLRMVEDRESFAKYLEIKMNTTKTYNTIWGSIIGMVLAIMAGVTINVISDSIVV